MFGKKLISLISQSFGSLLVSKSTACCKMYLMDFPGESRSK